MIISYIIFQYTILGLNANRDGIKEEKVVKTVVRFKQERK